MSVRKQLQYNFEYKIENASKQSLLKVDLVRIFSQNELK